MLKNSILQNSLIAVSAGVLIGLNFFIEHAYLGACMGIALLVFLSYKAPSWKHALWYGSLCGFIVQGALYAGVGSNLFPFDWYGIGSTTLQTIAIGLSWLCASIAFGLTIGLFAVGVFLLKTKTWLDLLLFPSVWVVCEFLNSFVYYFYMLGGGSFFGPHYTLSYVGYFLASNPVLLQLSWFGGVYALSFFAAFLGATFALFYTTPQKKLYVLILLAVACCLMVAYGALKVFDTQQNFSGDMLTVAVLSRYMPPTPDQTEAFEKERYNELLQVVLPLEAIDLIVFPENATFLRHLLNQERQPDLQRLIKTGASPAGPALIDSQDSYTDGYFSSRVTLLSATSRDYGEKQFLLAFGEYLPYAYQLALKLAGGDALQDALASRNYVPGEKTLNTIVDHVRVAVRFCDEVMSPYLYRTQVQDGAEVLINISSLSWFHGSSFVQQNIERIAKVRAVESGRWYIQSGNMAPAFVLDHKGHVVAKTTKNTLEALRVDVAPRSDTTLYVLFGPWIVYLAALFILMRSVVARHKKYR